MTGENFGERIVKDCLPPTSSEDFPKLAMGNALDERARVLPSVMTA